MSGVVLKYNGVAMGSSESFSVKYESTPPAPFVDYSQIFLGSLGSVHYGNPCEPYAVVLDGLNVPIPDRPEKANMGYWSEKLYKDVTNVLLRVYADDLFSSAGISMRFETIRDIFPTSVSVTWYRNNTQLASTIVAVKSAEVFVDKKVELYNRVDFQFMHLNMPNHRFRIESISFGLITEFTGKDLRSSQMTQQIDPIAATLPINTCNFTVVSEDIDFVFENRQPIMVYFNDRLMGMTFITNSQQTTKTTYNVKCEDYIGILDGATFKGGIYQNKRASEIVLEICNIAGVPVDFSPELDTVLLSGHIPYDTCRSALQQVLFASCCVADTSGATVLKIRTLRNVVQQQIQPERIMYGINISDTPRLTEVKVTQHDYTPASDVITVYEAEKSGSGDMIEVMFSEPLHSLEITKGTIVEQGANYAVINAKNKCVLTGKSYLHTTAVKSRKNPNILKTDKENVYTVDKATLVSADNVDKVLDVCYNYYVKNKKVNAKIIEGKKRNQDSYVYDTPVNLGDMIEVDTQFAGKAQCVAEKQTFSLNGGILVKDTVLR